MPLPIKNRLKGKREFSAVFSAAHPAVSEHLSLRVEQGRDAGGFRFAIVVPAKTVPLASSRNLLRRKTAEALSHIVKKSPVVPGIRAVIAVRTPRLPESGVLEHELLSLMKKSGILHS